MPALVLRTGEATPQNVRMRSFVGDAVAAKATYSIILYPGHQNAKIVILRTFGTLATGPHERLILQDSDFGLWEITCDGFGRLVSSRTANQSPQTLTLNTANYTQSWKVGVRTDGLLTTTVAVFSVANPTAYVLRDPATLISYSMGVI